MSEAYEAQQTFRQHLSRISGRRLMTQNPLIEVCVAVSLHGNLGTSSVVSDIWLQRLSQSRCRTGCYLERENQLGSVVWTDKLLLSRGDQDPNLASDFGKIVKRSSKQLASRKIDDY